jgi:hypothetical protein
MLSKNEQNKLYVYQSTIFNIVIIISYILYFVMLLGLYTNSEKYLTDLQFYVQIYVCSFLLFRFNPFRKIEFNELDRKVAFSAGLFILTTSGISKFFETFLLGKKDDKSSSNKREKQNQNKNQQNS